MSERRSSGPKKMVGRLGSHVARNAIAYLALFIALSGTAYAVATVGPRDIQNDAVRSRHIKDGQVKTDDLHNGAVTRDKLEFPAMPATVGYERGSETSIPADGQTHLLSAHCDAGDNVVGGGFTGSTFFRVAESYPSAADGTSPGRVGWTVRVQNTFGGGGAADGRVVAICVEDVIPFGTWP